ncbi:MAG: GDP-mannose 4,6-dehydratase [Deltaproteobacteria bacterium]|nr:GDP-mannose 4,6-dehydratase [Deltaproteobacteria bacterium]
MRALVTGAAGFIGSHLSERLTADGHDVVGGDCFIDYYARSIKERNLERLRAEPRFTFVEVDLNTLDPKALLAGVDWVFHQAAQAGVRASWGDSFRIYTRLNIDATQRLLEAAKSADRLKKLVYASSSSVYGDAATLPMLEDHPTHPLSPYGVTKLAAEHLAVLYTKNFGVPTASLRYFTVYGPRQRPDMAFHKFFKAALAGEEISVYGDGTQTRDFTYVSDAVEANVRAAASAPPGAVLNIGGGSRVSVREVLAMVEELVGRPVRVRYLEVQHGDMKDTVADTTRARELIDYRPLVSLRDGLARERDWVAALYGMRGA